MDTTTPTEAERLAIHRRTVSPNILLERIGWGQAVRRNERSGAPQPITRMPGTEQQRAAIRELVAEGWAPGSVCVEHLLARWGQQDSMRTGSHRDTLLRMAQLDAGENTVVPAAAIERIDQITLNQMLRDRADHLVHSAGFRVPIEGAPRVHELEVTSGRLLVGDAIVVQDEVDGQEPLHPHVELPARDGAWTVATTWHETSETSLPRVRSVLLTHPDAAGATVPGATELASRWTHVHHLATHTFLLLGDATEVVGSFSPDGWNEWLGAEVSPGVMREEVLGDALQPGMLLVNQAHASLHAFALVEDGQVIALLLLGRPWFDEEIADTDQREDMLVELEQQGQHPITTTA